MTVRYIVRWDVEKKAFEADPWGWIDNNLQDVNFDGFEVYGLWWMLNRLAGPSWGLQNIDRLSTVYQGLVNQWAREVYDKTVTIRQRFRYSERLHQELVARAKEKNSNYQVSVQRMMNEQPKYIELDERITLRELTRDFTWRYTEDGKPGAAEVRYAIRRCMSYLIEHRKGIREIRLAGKILYTMSDKWDPQLSDGNILYSKHRPQGIAKFAAAVVPLVYKNVLKGVIRQQQFIAEHPEIPEDFRQPVYRLYKLAGDVALDYLKQSHGNGRHGIHDAMYFLRGGMIDRLTPATARRLLSFSKDTVREICNGLDTILAERSMGDIKGRRKFVKSVVMSSDPIATIKDVQAEIEVANRKKMEKVERRQVRYLRQTLQLTERDIHRYNERLQRYSEYASVRKMVEMFGLESAGQMVKGTYEGIFEPEEFRMPLQFLGDLVRRALGRRGVGAEVQNPQRLYHRLARIGDVRAMLRGKFDDPQAVLKLLVDFGMQAPPTYEAGLRLRAVVEPKCSPEYLTAGDASVCCMSFGAGNMQTYAKEKGFGVLNIYLGERVIGNSVLWLNELPMHRALVLDNIEIHPNYVRFNELITHLYQHVAAKLMPKYGCVLTVQGESFSDLEIPTIEGISIPTGWRLAPIGVEQSQFYSDANQVRVVATILTADENKKWQRMVIEKKLEELAAVVA